MESEQISLYNFQVLTVIIENIAKTIKITTTTHM